MLTSDSALDALLAKFTHCAHAMLEAAETMQVEASRCALHGESRAAIDALGDRLSGTAQDVAHGLGELDGLAHAPASAPVSARIERIAGWLEADGEALRGTIDRLRDAPGEPGLPGDARAALAGTAEGVLAAIVSACAAIDTYRASLR